MGSSWCGLLPMLMVETNENEVLGLCVNEE